LQKLLYLILEWIENKDLGVVGNNVAML